MLRLTERDWIATVRMITLKTSREWSVVPDSRRSAGRGSRFVWGHRQSGSTRRRLRRAGGRMDWPTPPNRRSISPPAY